MSEAIKGDEIRARMARRRVTLDGQLVSYWDREALRLETLAEGARWNWTARGHRRRAERARAKSAVFAERERARAATPGESGPDPA
ncbi:hypothetical protein [Methylobacterium sp. J-068]|uniref:hypothetical protein n=1 Tax=Methylobacterium sp. J-068 TaxID=2836649 RepID=UPI001FBAF56F|nr:hypothetical protein [Methylobacterium sp. J-068]MCJ2032808.1 hypothetical protein [Methylobacterium sp. J-068]